MTSHDPLLAFRARFPILSRANYLISNSLGAMPGAARESVGVGAPRIGPPRSLECAGGGGYDTSPATPASA